MAYDPEKHHRRSVRLKDYDYGQSGAYFVTVATHDRTCLFGVVAEGEIQLNEAGVMIQHWWVELSRKFPTIETDEFVIMPNHFHVLLFLSHTGTGLNTLVGECKRFMAYEIVGSLKKQGKNSILRNRFFLILC